MVKLTATNIVGTASPLTWSQVQTITQDDEHKLIVVVKLSCKEEDSLIDLATVGAEMLSEIESHRAISGSEGLKSLVGEIVVGVAEGLEIAILIGAVRGNQLALCGQGEVEAYLSRGGQLAKLGDDWRGERVIGGELKEGDVFILATKKLVEGVGLTKFREIMVNDENPAELLAPLVHTQTDSSGAAAVLGGIKKEVKNFKWPQIKLRSETPRKANLWIGGAILLLLLLMIGVGMVRRVRQAAEGEYTNLSASVESKLTETKSIADLNPERARLLLSQAKGEVEAYMAADIKDEYRQKGQTLLGEIAQTDEQAFKKNEIELETVVELPILAEGLDAVGMKSDGKDNLVFVDTKASRVVLMNLIDRSRKIVESKESESLIDVGVVETKLYGLTKDSVVEMSLKKTEVKKAIEADEFWKSPTQIEMFAGNAYILDKEQGEIWKYPTLGETFGGRRRWFAAGITPDLSNVVDMKVIGDIWLLTSSGKLERYSRGAPAAFSLEGFPAKGEAKRFSEPRALWATDSLIYVLESGAGRIVVFGDDGKYQSQYVAPEFAKASDLVVVDDKGYVLIENTVKEFGL